MPRFKLGQKVEVNGNKEGMVIRQYADGMIEVRLWDGTRHVGDVVVSESDCDRIA